MSLPGQTMSGQCKEPADIQTYCSAVRTHDRFGDYAKADQQARLAPTNSLLSRLDVANDRQLYLALIGPAWWLSVKLSTLYRSRAALARTVTLLILVTLVCTTSPRVYDTEVTFWQDAIARNPTSARAANNLGMAHADDCKFDAAASEFRHAMKLDSADFRASINLMLLKQRDLPGAKTHWLHQIPAMIRNRARGSQVPTSA